MVHTVPHSYQHYETPNARIDLAAMASTSINASQMKAPLLPLRSNELLGECDVDAFIRETHGDCGSDAAAPASYQCPFVLKLMVHTVPHSYQHYETPNARIDLAAMASTSINASQMKAPLLPLRSNELLG